jgi:hypothetical protein
MLMPVRIGQNETLHYELLEPAHNLVDVFGGLWHDFHTTERHAARFAAIEHRSEH